MERFNSQLYEKYINLKKRKFSEIEESNKKRTTDTMKYQSAIEQLIEDLKNENDNLRVQIVSMQEQYQESQKFLLQERQKSKTLSGEVEALKETLAQKKDNLESASLRTPRRKSSIRLEESNKCLPMKNSLYTPSEQNPVQSETAIILHEIDNGNLLMLHDEPMNVSLQPDCCRRTKSNYGTGTDRSCGPCVFHTLVELLVGMKVSVEVQNEGLCFSVVHQMSGFHFTLSWARDGDGREEEELLYRVVSLGTIENVALEWMKDDMVFSLAMCPVFFDRLSRLVGHKR